MGKNGMTHFCLGAAFLCLFYFLILVLYAGIKADFAWIWIAGSAGFTVLGVVVRYEKIHPGYIPAWFRNSFIIVAAAGFLLFVFLCGKVIYGMAMAGEKNLDYVVVLGAQVKGDIPSRALKKRLEKAVEYANENPGTKLILSGGQGSGEDITEAECMQRYLLEKGISDIRLILENRSTDTKQNLIYSNDISGCASENTGILSNNFHVYRAVKLAEKQGYIHARGIAAPSDPLMQVHYVVREVFALVKEKVAGNI